MKKKLLFILLFVCAFSLKLAHAQPVVYERTPGNLLLPSDVDMTKISVDAVMRVPAVDAKAKIYDFADLLTDAEESQIYIQLNEFTNNTGLDAVIVTTSDLAGFAMSDYTYNFYDYNDFKDNGIAFVIYVSEDTRSIYMGNNGPRNSEVFTAYTDSRVASILKYVYQNHIQKNDYVGACESFIKLADGFYIKSFGTYHVTDGGDVVKSFPWISIMIITVFVSFIIVVLVISKYQKREKRVDTTLKKAIQTSSMIVKCEYDRPYTNRQQEETTQEEESKEEEPKEEESKEEEPVETNEEKLVESNAEKEGSKENDEKKELEDNS